MKIVFAILAAIGLAACGTADLNPNSSMYGARTYSSAVLKCQTDKPWLECDGRTPADANGGQ